MNKIHQDIIKKLAKRMARPSQGHYFDDLYQIGCIAYLRVLKSFDETKNVKFTSWLQTKVRYAILDYMGKVDRFKLADKIFEVIDFKTPETYYLGYETVDQWLDLIHKLKPSQKMIVLELFFEGKTQVKLAKQLDVSIRHINDLRDAALKELKKLYLRQSKDRKIAKKPYCAYKAV